MLFCIETPPNQNPKSETRNPKQARNFETGKVTFRLKPETQHLSFALAIALVEHIYAVDKA
jgi:hypothetical protein